MDVEDLRAALAYLSHLDKAEHRYFSQDTLVAARAKHYAFRVGSLWPIPIHRLPASLTQSFADDPMPPLPSDERLWDHMRNARLAHLQQQTKRETRAATGATRRGAAAAGEKEAMKEEAGQRKDANINQSARADSAAASTSERNVERPRPGIVTLPDDADDADMAAWHTASVSLSRQLRLDLEHRFHYLYMKRQALLYEQDDDDDHDDADVEEEVDSDDGEEEEEEAEGEEERAEEERTEEERRAASAKKPTRPFTSLRDFHPGVPAFDAAGRLLHPMTRKLVQVSTEHIFCKLEQTLSAMQHRHASMVISRSAQRHKNRGQKREREDASSDRGPSKIEGKQQQQQYREPYDPNDWDGSSKKARFDAGATIQEGEDDCYSRAHDGHDKEAGSDEDNDDADSDNDEEKNENGETDDDEDEDEDEDDDDDDDAEKRGTEGIRKSSTLRKKHWRSRLLPVLQADDLFDLVTQEKLFDPSVIQAVRARWHAALDGA